MSKLFDMYAGLLAMNDTFQKGVEKKLSFTKDDEKLRELSQKYQLEKLVEENQFKTAINFLNWMNEHLLHGNEDHSFHERDALNILAQGYNNEKARYNCMEQSIALSECLLSVGILAYPIWMYPYSPYDLDNHVVVHVFVKDLNKWIMIDPTWNSYCISEGEILNLFEMRELLSKRKIFKLNDDVKYNGQSLKEIGTSEEELIDYYAKNCFCFSLKVDHGYGHHLEKLGYPMYYLLPENFAVLKKEKINMEYRLEMFKSNEKWAYAVPMTLKQMEELQHKKIAVISIENLK